MSKRAGISLIALGTALILAAVFLMLHNQLEDRRAGEEAEKLFAEMQTVIPEQEPPQELAPEMPAVTIDGYDYVGTLSVPSLELTLPIMSQWDYERLKLSPCRHFGSTRTDDLVIAAHNYRRHFGTLHTLKKGDAVSVTDTEGILSQYQVEAVDVVGAYSVEEIRDSGYDLVLYTCTYSGAERVAVFCDRIAE